MLDSWRYCDRGLVWPGWGSLELPDIWLAGFTPPTTGHPARAVQGHGLACSWGAEGKAQGLRRQLELSLLNGREEGSKCMDRMEQFVAGMAEEATALCRSGQAGCGEPLSLRASAVWSAC